MTHDDWQTGIQNEADSVQDTDWSRDTRRHLRRRAWLTATLITLGFTILALSLTAVLNAALVGALAPVPPGAMNIIVSIVIDIYFRPLFPRPSFIPCKT